MWMKNEWINGTDFKEQESNQTLSENKEDPVVVNLHFDTFCTVAW